MSVEGFEVCQCAQIGNRMLMVELYLILPFYHATSSPGQRQPEHLNFCRSFAETSGRAWEILNATESVISEKAGTNILLMSSAFRVLET